MATVSPFVFSRVDSFFDDINREDCFDTKEMNGNDKNFKIVLASDCPTRIEDCLDAEGTLNDNVNIINTMGEEDGLLALLWSKGINGERTMSIPQQTLIYEFPNQNINIKGAFLISYENGSGYVLAYCINNVSLDIPKNDQLICPINDVIVSLIYGA